MYIMQELIRRNMAYYAQCGTRLRVPPASTDMEQLARQGLNDKLFQDKFFRLPDDGEEDWHDPSEPRWEHIPGCLQRQNGHAVLIPDSGDPPIALYSEDPDRGGFPEGDHVHLMTEYMTGTVSQFHVPDSLYALVEPFADPCGQGSALMDYLHASSRKKQLIRAFLTDMDAAQNLFSCFAFLFAAGWEEAAGLPKDTVIRLTEEFNRSYASSLRCTAVDPLDMVALLEISGLPEGDGNRRWPTLLYVWAMLRGCTPASRENRGLACLLMADDCTQSRLFEECFRRVCTPDLAEPLIRELAALSISSGYYRKQADRHLVNILLLEKPLTTAAVAVAVNHLFRRQLTVTDVRNLHRIMAGRNADAIENDVNRRFRHSVLHGGDDFADAMAAILMHRLGSRDQILSAALDAITDSAETKEILIGMSMLRLQLQQETVDSPRLWTALSGRQKAAAALTLVTVLKDASHPLYAAACRLSYSLYLAGVFDGQLVGCPDILSSLCRVQYRSPASPLPELVLGMVPLSAVPLKTTGLPLLTDQLEWNYRQALQCRQHQNIVRLFHACAAAGCWEGRQLMQQYAQLAAFLDEHRQQLHTADRSAMLHLQNEINGTLLFPEYNESPLPSEKASPMEPMWAKEENPEACVLHSAGEVLALMRFLRERCDNDASFIPKAAGLLERCSIDDKLQDCGIIADWFFLLCCFGCTDQALAFYQTRRAVLDRPWRYRPESEAAAILLPCRNTARFFREDSRLVRGLKIAAVLHRTGVTSTFFTRGILSGDDIESVAETIQDWNHGKLPDGFPAQMMENILLDPDNTEKTLWEIQSLVTHQLLRQALSGCKPDISMEYWHTHYDDRLLTRLVLEHCPESHRTILTLGYGAQREMVQAAVGVCPESAKYACLRLRQESQSE